jgi:hypothetical protein
VTAADVMGFITAQRHDPSSIVDQLADGGNGSALSTIKRRRRRVSGLYSHHSAPTGWTATRSGWG